MDGIYLALPNLSSLTPHCQQPDRSMRGFLLPLKSLCCDNKNLDVHANRAGSALAEGFPGHPQWKELLKNSNVVVVSELPTWILLAIKA
jgi:hypothetical protein